MKLTQIRHLIAVAERGSLPSGADELGASRAALMRSIRELERELGSALFTRAHGAMTLTPMGEIFVRRAAAAQRELDRASDEVGRTAGPSTELVAIGLSAGAHASVLPAVLAPFHARFDAVRLRIVEGAFAAAARPLRDGTLDLYVGPIGPDEQCDELTVDEVGGGARIIVGRAGHSLADAASLADLAGARWVAGSRADLRALFERRGLPEPAVAVEAATGLGMTAAVAASDALLLAPESWLAAIERTGVLVAFRRIGPLDGPPIRLAMRTRPPPPSPAAAFLRDLILRTARGDR